MGSRRALALSLRWVIFALMLAKSGSVAFPRIKEQHYFSAKGGAPMAFSISSPSFQNGKDIPKQFTCDGDDVSPALSWTDPPQGVKSFALILTIPMHRGERGLTGCCSTCHPRLLRLRKACRKLANYRTVDAKVLMIFPKSATEARARLPANLIVTFSSCMRLTTNSI